MEGRILILRNILNWRVNSRYGVGVLPLELLFFSFMLFGWLFWVSLGLFASAAFFPGFGDGSLAVFCGGTSVSLWSSVFCILR